MPRTTLPCSRTPATATSLPTRRWLRLKCAAQSRLESRDFSCPSLRIRSRLRTQDSESIQRIGQWRDNRAQIIEHEDRSSLPHEQHEMVLSGCSDDDLGKEKCRTRPSGLQQEMALGDGVVTAITFVRKYLPLCVSPACGRLLWRYAEIHRRIDLSKFSPTLDRGAEVLDPAVVVALAVLGILKAEL